MMNRAMLAGMMLLAMSGTGLGQERGSASWYGTGRGATVAHRTHPMGTVLIVRNLRNGRSARAVVVTRGPYAKGRVLDVSRGLARHLDMEKRGTAPVEVTVMQRPTGRRH